MKSFCEKKVVILSAAVVLLSCDSPNSIDLGITQLYGSWNWISASGGFFGETLTPESTGETRKTVFNQLGTASFYVSGVLQRQLGFTVVKEKPSPSAPEYWMVHYSGGSGYVPEQILSYRGRDTLVLSDYCMDCWQYVYVRMK